jgi:hypothetical protein
VECTGEGRDACVVLVGEPEGRRTLGRPERQWEDNTKVDLHEIGGRVDWIDLAQDRDKWWCLGDTKINRRFP